MYFLTLRCLAHVQHVFNVDTKTFNVVFGFFVLFSLFGNLNILIVIFFSFVDKGLPLHFSNIFFAILEFGFLICCISCEKMAVRARERKRKSAAGTEAKSSGRQINEFSNYIKNKADTHSAQS